MFNIEKEFMVIGVEEVVTKNGAKWDDVKLLDWESGATTTFRDFDQKYRDLKPKQSVKCKIRIGTKRNKKTNFDEWAVYLNEVNVIEA